MPNRTEKEPMRPLYIYYKKLKQQLVNNFHLFSRINNNSNNNNKITTDMV